MTNKGITYKINSAVTGSYMSQGSCLKVKEYTFYTLTWQDATKIQEFNSCNFCTEETYLVKQSSQELVLIVL